MEARGGGARGARLRYAAAALAFVAELIHLWAVTQEFAVFPTRGLPLIPIAACQGVLAMSLLFGPSRWMLGFGVLFNLLVASLWAFTRIVGVPSGEVFVRLPVGVADLAVTVVEIVLVVLLVELMRDLRRRKWKGRQR
jgi:hypothetical protein